MPEKFPLPEIKGRPKKNGKDITRGEMTEKGVWKSEELGKSEANLSNATTPKGFRKFVPEKVSDNQTTEESDEIVDEMDADAEPVGQKSSNIETKKTENFYIKPSIHTRTRQEVIKSGRKKTRRVQRKITSQEPDMYEAIFNG